MTLVERLMQYQVNKGIECSLLSEVEDKLIEQAQRIEELESTVEELQSNGADSSIKIINKAINILKPD